jgi:hypothetical protein
VKWEKGRKPRGVKKTRHAKNSMLQRRRQRTALALAIAFVGLFVLLSVQQSRELDAATPSTLGYLMTADEPLAADPLDIASQSLELVGVSSDGMIVGYATDCTVAQTMAKIDKAMCAKGWSALGMSAEGVSSYIWQGETVQAPSMSPAQGEAGAPVPQLSQGPQTSQTTRAYVLFVCSERDGGSSVVAEFL